MCGIAGIFGIGGDIKPHLLTMMAAMHHRGPDGHGVFVDGDAAVGLGHRRLAILDIREAAGQPLYNEDGTIAVVHNGEIYNHMELRRELEARGHRFKTHVDSEVILHAYEEYGERCTEFFNGMWAFCLWDARNRTMMLSRDRLGIKPLYLAETNGGIAFASEIKALIAAFPSLRDWRMDAVVDFFQEHLTDHEDGTFFSAIRQVPPAHDIFYDVDLRCRRRRYWAIEGTRRFGGTTQDAATALRALLEDSVRLQLRADVPVGAAMSGGLDSTAIVALASRMVDQPVRTFTAVFPDYPRCNETEYVAAMGKAFPLDSQTISPGADRAMENLTRAMHHLDEPVTSPAVATWWPVSEAVGRSVKVLLTGHGGDEALGGYYKYFRPLLHHLLNMHGQFHAARVPVQVREAWRSLRRNTGADDLADTLASHHWPWARKLGSRWLQCAGRGSPRSPWACSDAYLPDFARLCARRAAPEDFPDMNGLDPVRQSMLRDLRSNYLPSILRNEDRLSMAHSFESRVPLLDHRIIEFAYSLPGDYLIRDGLNKAVLRDALVGVIPEKVRRRSDKMGYSTPFAYWLLGDLGKEVESLLCHSGSHIGQLFDIEAIRQAIANHRNRRGNSSVQIFKWLSFELWAASLAPARLA